MNDWRNIFQRHANTDGVSTATEGMLARFAIRFAKMLDCFVMFCYVFKYFFNELIIITLTNRLIVKERKQRNTLFYVRVRVRVRLIYVIY